MYISISQLTCTIDFQTPQQRRALQIPSLSIALEFFGNVMLKLSRIIGYFDLSFSMLGITLNRGRDYSSIILDLVRIAQEQLAGDRNRGI